MLTHKEKEQKRDRKKAWVHYGFGDFVHFIIERNDRGHTTFCGKTAERIGITTVLADVTCPRCLEVAKEQDPTGDEEGRGDE